MSSILRTIVSVTKASFFFRSLSHPRSARSSPFKVESVDATLAVRAGRPMERKGGAPEAAVNKSLEELRPPANDGPMGGWKNLWDLGIIPWDLGEPTPIVVHLAETGSLPKGRALVPGCGTGYDVVAMASPDLYVVGMEISETSVERSNKMFSSLPNSKYFSFVVEDFFTWQPAELFDLIFDYNFFCAFNPSVRPLWAKRMHDLLKPGGELITLIFPLTPVSSSGGPPYVVTASDYEEVLIPAGFEAVSIVDNDITVPSRKGMEKLGRWKKSDTRSTV